MSASKSRQVFHDGPLALSIQGLAWMWSIRSCYLSNERTISALTKCFSNKHPVVPNKIGQVQLFSLLDDHHVHVCFLVDYSLLVLPLVRSLLTKRFVKQVPMKPWVVLISSCPVFAMEEYTSPSDHVDVRKTD